MLSTILKFAIGTIAGAIFIKEIKKANIFYDKVRNEILNQWDKIHLTEQIENIN